MLTFCAQLEALASVQAARTDINLGPRPGRLKSTARAPDKLLAPTQSLSGKSAFPDAGSENDEESMQQLATFDRSAKSLNMVDLDGSDAEPEVEPPS